MFANPAAIAMVLIYAAVIAGAGAMLFLAARRDGEVERHHRWLRR
jgi:hypothetical protein